MPEPLKKSEVTAEKDPSVSKQYDASASLEQKLKDFYEIADGQKIGMLGTYRNGIGPVSRSMAVAKRTGPDFLFLTNSNSKKIQDLQASKQVQLSFHDSSKQDWISVTGEAVTVTNDDPRIKEIYSKPVSAWFGDLKDGVHDGGPEDPRMTLIEVQPKYVVYWKRTTGAIGMAKEIGGAVLTGGVANTGALREVHSDEIAQARAKDSALSSK
ncbi:hypothetical protein MYCGRDRAFT_83301 [Lecanosticta acicola]|uniref:General stress protein FMN-binding split barrel domain-containing protein n=1 Tax=Lecanosticta acicola TaxID=111012 RepID=A0AAI9EAH7_9PEZI|nr:hypothetical protein MYCGRDRAFT_83301 [Lecanosticta acicola]